MLIRKIISRLPIVRLSHFAAGFRGLHQFSVDNKNEKRFQEIRMHTTLSQYSGLQVTYKQHTKNETHIIRDEDTGLQFLIESGGFPGCSDMGICLKLGTQDENQLNAGSLQCLKSFVHMKPTFQQLVGNYQILNQTGSQFDLNYDTVTTYAKASFLEEDKDLMSDLLLDLVIQQKTLMQDSFETEISLSDINQLVRRSAFGFKGLGMPSKGIGNTLVNKQFLNFQQKITPKNMIISISNINNPLQFIKKIKDSIRKKYPKFLQRKPQPSPKSEYHGGYHTFQSDSQFFQFALAYPSVPTRSPHMELFNILRVLLGSASSFSSGGPGKGMHSRCTQNLLNSVQCVESASFINEHFEQHGIFGLTVSGLHEYYLQVIECTTIELAKLAQSIPEEQLQRAKNILISTIYQNIERQSQRLQQLTKHIYCYDRIKLFEFEENIRKITGKQIQSVMKQIFRKKPTMVFSGNQKSLRKLPTQQSIKSLFTEVMNSD